MVDARMQAPTAFLASWAAAAMNLSSGPYMPFAPDIPGDGAPAEPPPSISVGAVGRFLGVVDVDEEDVAFPFVELLFEPPDWIGITVEMTCEITAVVLSPADVDRTVVTTVVEPPPPPLLLLDDDYQRSH